MYTTTTSTAIVADGVIDFDALDAALDPYPPESAGAFATAAISLAGVGALLGAACAFASPTLGVVI